MHASLPPAFLCLPSLQICSPASFTYCLPGHEGEKIQSPDNLLFQIKQQPGSPVSQPSLSMITLRKPVSFLMYFNHSSFFFKEAVAKAEQCSAWQQQQKFIGLCFIQLWYSSSSVKHSKSACRLLLVFSGGCGEVRKKKCSKSVYKIWGNGGGWE